MEKEIRELTKQRDLAQSRVEDLLRMVGKEQISGKVVSILIIPAAFTLLITLYLLLNNLMDFFFRGHWGRLCLIR